MPEGDLHNASRENVGYLLAKASQRWNELLYKRFRREGFKEVRPSYGSIVLPLFEEDGLRMGKLAECARLSKQTMTTMIRLLERDGLVRRQRDPEDRRAFRVYLTARARSFQPVAESVLREMDELVEERLSKAELSRLKASLKEVMAL
jgi:MarR family transcriptional regulator, lower aerobic nicotinate degradation pathway regulator